MPHGVHIVFRDSSEITYHLLKNFFHYHLRGSCPRSWLILVGSWERSAEFCVEPPLTQLLFTFYYSTQSVLLKSFVGSSCTGLALVPASSPFSSTGQSCGAMTGIKF